MNKNDIAKKNILAIVQTRNNLLDYVFYVPSFYGLVSWSAWLFLYSLHLIRLDTIGFATALVYTWVEIAFLGSLIISLPRYRKLITSQKIKEQVKLTYNKAYKSTSVKPLIVLYILGFYGIYKYITDFSLKIGGFDVFIITLFSNASAIRALDTISIGTQIGYFGWLAIGVTAYQITKKQISNLWWFLAFLLFVGNCLYIDRTKPVYIIFLSVLVMLYSSAKINFKSFFKYASILITSIFLMFWLMAFFSDKLYYKNIEEETILPGITYDVYSYGVSAFSYFNKIIDDDEAVSYSLKRTLYPLDKALNILGVTEEPINPILEFYQIPFLTNVSTFLEPLYHDGGFILVIIGILMLSFGFDLLGFYSIKGENPYTVYFWATLCLANFFCFVSMKAGDTFFYVFGLIALASQAANKLISELKKCCA